MKKLLTSVVLALVSAAVVAADANSTTNAPRRSLRRNFGGFVIKPGSVKGEILIGNSQEKVAQSVIDQALKDFRRMFDPAIRVAPMPAPDVKLAAKAVSDSGAQAVLFFIDDPALPSLLSAPESAWVMVNVAPIAAGVDEAKLAVRARLELVRGLALLCGAHSSSYPDTIMGPVKTPADLDRMNPTMSLPVDVASSFIPYMQGFGVTQIQRVQYRRACQEGWAPAPTNDVQQAIWDKVHALPTEPMKILPESQRQK